MAIPNFMKNLFLIPVLMLSVQCAEAQTAPELEGGLNPMVTVDHVELDRYLGKWFEIAKYPNRFQRGCDEATAEYAKLPSGDIEVHNTCKKLSNGQLKDIIGVAKVMDRNSNAKLKVSFLPKWLRWTGIGFGKYWVIALEPNYEYAVVSEPSRKFLWILSRTPSLKRSTYEGILQKITEQQLDVSKLQFSRENPIRD